MQCNYCGSDIEEDNTSMSCSLFSVEDEVSGETFSTETHCMSGYCERCGVSTTVEEYREGMGEEYYA